MTNPLFYFCFVPERSRGNASFLAGEERHTSSAADRYETL